MTGPVYITYRATFCAAHRLHSDHLSDEENKAIFSKCNNENGHGHNYTLYLTLQGIPDPKTGMIINFTEIKNIVNKYIIEPMDHRHLNLDVPEFKDLNPTSENMVIVFWNILNPHFPNNSLYEVKLTETENNTCYYRG